MVPTPSFILPRDAGEERGGGLNRLNVLNVIQQYSLQRVMLSPGFSYLDKGGGRD
jgi:hypothetical protein